MRKYYNRTMVQLPGKLQLKLEERQSGHALRHLPPYRKLIDFSSNDYLGFSRNESLFKAAGDLLNEGNMRRNGATGSRLLTGNMPLYGELELFLAAYFEAEAALVFNSGYDANLGFFSAVPQRGDLVFYDALCHASIRDGIALGHAQSYKFKHNSLEDLEAKLKWGRNKVPEGDIYVVTESVFSMDGDMPDLKAMASLCATEGCYLIVDEAHGVGVFGAQGEGVSVQEDVHESIFARVVTFGKAMGGHGAAIVGSEALKRYLVNFARSFIYTTALPPHAAATILVAFKYLAVATEERERLAHNIQFFREQVTALQLDPYFIPSSSAIHCCVVAGGQRVKIFSKRLAEHGFDVKPILSPTVPMGKERLRFCLHQFNTEAEIAGVLGKLSVLFQSQAVFLE